MLYIRSLFLTDSQVYVMSANLLDRAHQNLRIELKASIRESVIEKMFVTEESFIHTKKFPTGYLWNNKTVLVILKNSTSNEQDLGTQPVTSAQSGRSLSDKSWDLLTSVHNANNACHLFCLCKFNDHQTCSLSSWFLSFHRDCFNIFFSTWACWTQEILQAESTKTCFSGDVNVSLNEWYSLIKVHQDIISHAVGHHKRVSSLTKCGL